MAHGRRAQMKMSEETFNLVCTACARDNKTVEAVQYCVECCGYCCQTCTDVHQKFPTLTGHNLMDVHLGPQAASSGTDQSRVLELPTERCNKHKAKVVDMYCGSHEVVGCYVCIATDHKSCDSSHIHSIPDMIDTLFKLSDCKQTQRHLKNMMVFMDTVGKSKDTKLQSLNKAKMEALDDVTASQKVLEAIIRKAAESSKQEVITAYKELENEILHDKNNAAEIQEALKTSDDKLTKSDGNRAQQFVCSKLAEETIKKAEKEMTKQELKHHFNAQITFVPDHELIESIKGIGQVQKHEKQKHDLYKIKGSSDINIKLDDDSADCNSHGCCLTHDNQLLVTDADNKKLKRFNAHSLLFVDYCTLDCEPCGVCCISEREVAVAGGSGNKIQFASIHNKMTPTRQIEMPHFCYGIAFNGDKLFVTDNSKSLFVYNMTGSLLKTISQDEAGNPLFEDSRHITISQSGNRVFVGCWYSGLVCLDGLGNYFSTFKYTGTNASDGLCIDSRGNVFVIYCYSHMVVQYNESGEKVGVVVKERDGLLFPHSVCFHQGMNRMFVTMAAAGKNVVKMYEMK